MFKTETKQIGNSAYKVTQLPGLKGLRILADIGKMLGPSIGKLTENADNDGGTLENVASSLQEGGFSMAVQLLVDNYSQAKVETIIEEMAKNTMFDPEGGEQFRPLWKSFDVHFAGNFSEMFQWLRFSLEVQYGNFFESLAGLGDLSSAGEANPAA